MARSQRSGEDPRELTAEVKRMLNETILHLGDDVRATDDAKAQALFETTREVLNGLVTAYEHFETGEETAWK